MALTNIPAFPARSDPNFSTYVDNFFTSVLPNFVSELDDTVIGFNNGSFTTTSTTSQTLNGTTPKTFTVGAGLSFVKGMWLTITENTAATTSNNYFIARVQSYSGTTLVVDIVSFNGSATLANWRMAISPPVLGATAIGTEAIYTNASGYGTVDTFIRIIGTLSKNNLVGATITNNTTEGTVCTINAAGTYAFSYYDTGATFYLSLNSAIKTAAPAVAERLGVMPTNSTTLTRIIKLAANDKVRPHAAAAGVATNSAAFFSVTRLA